MNTKVTGTYLCICSEYFCILLYTSVYYMYMYMYACISASFCVSVYLFRRSLDGALT